MGRDVSIAISARDNYSQAVTKMAEANRRFSDDVDGLRTKLKALDESRTTIKVEMDQAKKELRELEKQFKKTGDAGDLEKIKESSHHLEEAGRSYRMLGQQARQAEKDILSMTGAISRAENRAGGAKEMLSSLSQAGLFKMVGDSVSGFADTTVSSAFGSTMGSALSTAMSSAFSGAAMGMMAGGLPGALAGGVIGTVAGGISAADGWFSTQDEAFMGARNSLVEAQWQQREADITSASEIAMGREKQGVQMTHTFGDAAAGQAFLEDTINLANTTPFYYSDLLGVGMTYKAFGYTNEELFEEQQRMADVAAIRGWDASTMEQMASNMGYMRQSGKVNLQQIKQLQQRGINVPRYLAIAGSEMDEELSQEDILELINASDDELRERGVSLSEEDIYKMISSGEIDGAKAVRAISDYMAIEFEGGASKLAETFYGAQAQLGGLEEQMLAAMGEGYNEVRHTGMQEQIDYLSGEGGAQMQEANRLIGQWQAGLDNEREELLRSYERDALARIERDGLSGAEAGKVLAQARIDAQIEYANTDGAKMLNQMELDLLEETSRSLAASPELYQASLAIGKAQAKGILDGLWTGRHGSPICSPAWRRRA